MAIRFLVARGDTSSTLKWLPHHAFLGDHAPSTSSTPSHNATAIPAQTDPIFDPLKQIWSSGPTGLAPLYCSTPASGAQRIAGSEAREVSVALGQPSLDPAAMYEDLALGFRLGRRSLFHGVERLSPDQYVQLSESGPRIATHDPEVSSQQDASDALEVVSTRAAELAAQDSVLELSGGVDSRVVLALALRGGQTPPLAFTLGHQGSPDVVVARDIAARFDIEHIVVEPHAVSESISADAHDYARASGYACSTTSYAWLPSVFRRLAPRRRIQLSGVGGECAGGFYYTPLDRFSHLPGFTRAWIKYRLCIPDAQPSRFFVPSAAAELAETVTREIVALLSPASIPWRARTDTLYKAQRLRMWAGASLRAASHWYYPQAPLLWPEFTPWIQQVAQQTDDPRQALVDLVGQLDPELATVPYAKDIQASRPKVHRSSKSGRIARKVLRRLRQSPKPAELGASQVAVRLAACPKMRECIECLLAAQSGVLDPDAIQSTLAEPERNSYALGFLFTWSLAQFDLEHSASALQSVAAP